MEPIASYGMNFGELISRVYLMIEDPAGERFPLSLVKTALNVAVLDMVLETQIIKEKLTVHLAENIFVYEIQALAEAAGKRAFAYPVRIVYDRSCSPALFPTTTAKMDLSGFSQAERNRPSGWRTDLYPSGQIVFSPIPNVSGSALPLLTGNIELTYVAYPAPMIADTDVPDTLTGQYHEILAARSAEMILDEGGEEDLMIAQGIEKDSVIETSRITGDEYRGMTQYDAIRPM